MFRTSNPAISLLTASGVLIALCFVSTSATATDQPLASADLEEISDAQFVQFLNRMEVTAELNTAPYRVRLIRDREQGECDSQPESCPKEELYIAVSTFDEVPDFNAYRLAGSFGWKFVNWRKIPDVDSVDQFVSFTVERKVLSGDSKESWWDTEEVHVEVNPWRGSYELTRE